MSRNDRRNWQVFLGTISLLGGLSAAWLASVELSDDNIRVATRSTVRVAFVLYLVVLVARPLQQLLRKDWTAALLRNRRLVGVAFAAAMTAHLGLIGIPLGIFSGITFHLARNNAMTAHLGLIIYRFKTHPILDLPPPNLVGYGAYAVFYLMLITSFDRPKRLLGPRAWKILHRTGLVWAAIVFVAPQSLEEFADPVFLTYLVAFLLALSIRVTAWRQLRRPGSRRYAP